MRRLFLGTFIFIIYRLISWSWRVTEVIAPEMKRRHEAGLPFILAHWHGDELSIFHLIKKYNIATITSTSRDGELVDQVIRLLGGKTSRGSSTRGGIQALKGLLRLVRQGHSTSFAVDGPKGPIYQVKSGVIEVSRLTELPIFVCGVYSPSAWRFKKSWNQSFFPKPFSKLYIEWAGPHGPFTKADDPRDPKILADLGNALQNLRIEATKKF